VHNVGSLPHGNGCPEVRDKVPSLLGLSRKNGHLETTLVSSLGPELKTLSNVIIVSVRIYISPKI
jgi:hypothetical protein